MMFVKESVDILLSWYYWASLWLEGCLLPILNINFTSCLIGSFLWVDISNEAGAWNISSSCDAVQLFRQLWKPFKLTVLTLFFTIKRSATKSLSGGLEHPVDKLSWNVFVYNRQPQEFTDIHEIVIGTSQCPFRSHCLVANFTNIIYYNGNVYSAAFCAWKMNITEG